ncbi:hypothetical protein L5G28_07885 [Gordonia sp. HY285]|uniref:hypothetical protein n=1 Tax=Gordonia liuliyuniae TaxID=2911517 RepID=UPI001F45D1E4|nr:hypothetical protein [Gordonia liuliyuniae]MCF8610082.1 hypothetical protein [Gordonia liuliyuniae]
MEVQAWVYRSTSRSGPEKDARAACLRAVVADAVEAGIGHLVIEQDDGMVTWDNQALITATRDLGVRDEFRWEHARARSETLLSVPDVIAWCYRKGDYHARISHLITRERDVINLPVAPRRKKRR